MSVQAEHKQECKGGVVFGVRLVPGEQHVGHEARRHIEVASSGPILPLQLLSLSVAASVAQKFCMKDQR